MSISTFLQDSQRRELNRTVRANLERLAADDAATTSTDVAASLDAASAALRAWPQLLDGLVTIAENTRLSAVGRAEQASALITERMRRAGADIDGARARLDSAERAARQEIDRTVAAPLDGALAIVGTEVRARVNFFGGDGKATADTMQLRSLVANDPITARAILGAPLWLSGIDAEQAGRLRDAAAEAHAPGAAARLALIEKLRAALAGLERSWTAAAATVAEQFERQADAERRAAAAGPQPVDERGRPRRRAAG